MDGWKAVGVAMEKGAGLHVFSNVVTCCLSQESGGWLEGSGCGHGAGGGASHVF